MIEFIASIVISFLLGYATSWHFARQSSQELEQKAAELQSESAKIRLLTTAMVNGMEQMGWIRVHRDTAGEILGFHGILQANTATATAAAPPASITAGQGGLAAGDLRARLHDAYLRPWAIHEPWERLCQAFDLVLRLNAAYLSVCWYLEALHLEAASPWAKKLAEGLPWQLRDVLEGMGASTNDGT